METKSTTPLWIAREQLVAEHQRLSGEHVRMLEQAQRWGTTMVELGVGLVDRPHHVYVMLSEQGVAAESTEVVRPSSELPTLPQIHQLADRIRRTKTRLDQLARLLS